MTDQKFYGPRLIDATITLIELHGLTGKDLVDRYGVGNTWLTDVKSRPLRAPSCDTVQRIYEDLTGLKLVKPSKD